MSDELSIDTVAATFELDPEMIHKYGEESSLVRELEAKRMRLLESFVRAGVRLDRTRKRNTKWRTRR